jgi:hypothetical protein
MTRTVNRTVHITVHITVNRRVNRTVNRAASTVRILWTQKPEHFVTLVLSEETMGLGSWRQAGYLEGRVQMELADDQSVICDIVDHGQFPWGRGLDEIDRSLQIICAALGLRQGSDCPNCCSFVSIMSGLLRAQVFTVAEFVALLFP